MVLRGHAQTPKSRRRAVLWVLRHVWMLTTHSGRTTPGLGPKAGSAARGRASERRRSNGMAEQRIEDAMMIAAFRGRASAWRSARGANLRKPPILAG